MYISQVIYTVYSQTTIYSKYLLMVTQFNSKCFQSGRTGKGSVVRLGKVWLLGQLGCDCFLKGSFHSVYWAI